MNKTKSPEDFGKNFHEFLDNNAYVAVKKTEINDFMDNYDNLKAENEDLKKALSEMERFGCTIQDETGYVCGYITENKQLKAENERLKAELNKHCWIPVSERLPEDELKVSVSDGSVIWTSWYKHRSGEWMTMSTRPTHWKPIILPI